MTKATVRAAIYARISQDRSGAAAGVERQVSACRSLIEQRGWALTSEPYVDNDLSGNNRNTMEEQRQQEAGQRQEQRPAFARLVRDVADGKVDHLVVWHTDRLYRVLIDLQRVVEMAKSSPNLRIHSVTASENSIDLSSATGLLHAEILASVASYEVRHRSERVTAAARSRAEQGRWHGGRAFGYGPGGVLIPEEARIVRQMAYRLLAGESLRGITNWLNAEGVPTTYSATRSEEDGRRVAFGGTSGMWHPNAVRAILSAARLSAQREYLSKEERKGGSVFGTIIGDGQWEPILTKDETTRIRALLSNPDRRTTRSSLNLLSGIATCSLCGRGLMTASDRTHGKRYVCKRMSQRPGSGGVIIRLETLDALVEESLLYRLGRTSWSDVAVDDTDESERAAQIRVVTAAEERLTEAEREYGAGDITRTQYQARVEGARSVIQRAEAALGASARTTILASLPLDDSMALHERWAAMTVPQKRAVISGLLEKLLVKPSSLPRGTHEFDKTRVEIEWKF